MGVTKEAMEKAVNWWAEKVGGSQPHSNGDNGLASVMACMMADVGRKPVSESQIAVFKEELAKEDEKSAISSEFFNKWVKFETYRKIVFKDDIWN